jgi:hypothetical protein
MAAATAQLSRGIDLWEEITISSPLSGVFLETLKFTSHPLSVEVLIV